MQRDVATITAELREVVNILASKSVTGEDRERFLSRFRDLHAEQKRARRAETPQSIYFLQAPSVGLVKIGRTVNVATRVSSLRLSSPVPVILIGTVPGGPAEETEMHARWAALRSHGEWFIATDALMLFIREQIDGPVFDRTAAAR